MSSNFLRDKGPGPKIRKLIVFVTLGKSSISILIKISK